MGREGGKNRGGRRKLPVFDVFLDDFIGVFIIKFIKNKSRSQHSELKEKKKVKKRKREGKERKRKRTLYSWAF